MQIKRRVLVGAWRTHQKGMTLLEIVVSMLIVALGLAMSVSMIQSANRFGDTAEYTAFALQKSQLIIDTMRANALAKETYVVNGINANPNNGDYKNVYDSLSSIYDAANKDAALSRLVDNLRCKNSACTLAEENAKADVYAWADEIMSTLPGGRALLRKNNDNYEVIIMWKHVSATGNESDVPVQGTQVWFAL